MGTQSAVKRGARATSKFTKTLLKIAEKAAPVLGALLNLAAKVLTLGAKAVGFLSEHLWIWVPWENKKKKGKDEKQQIVE